MVPIPLHSVQFYVYRLLIAPSIIDNLIVVLLEMKHAHSF